MNEETKVLQAVKFVSDWAKWLITIETGILAIIGAFFSSAKDGVSQFQKVFGVASVICFFLSIFAAALLLWTLPEITQYLRVDKNIWSTSDEVAKRIFRMNTQGFAIAETLFFLLGILFFSVLIFTIIWSS